MLSVRDGVLGAVNTAASDPREIHVLSLGVGVQSTTLYVLACLRKLKIDVAIVADTQEESGAARRALGKKDFDPSRSFYAHLEWLQDFGMRHNGPPILNRTAGSLGEDLKSGRNSTGQRFASIPAFTTNGATVGRTRRQCSKEYKVEVVEKTIRREVLRLDPGRPVPRGVCVHQYIGFSLEETGRMRRLVLKKKRRGWTLRFPLIEMFWTRADCVRFLKNFVPHEVPKSACVFCPYRGDAEWI